MSLWYWLRNSPTDNESLINIPSVWLANNILPTETVTTVWPGENRARIEVVSRPNRAQRRRAQFAKRGR